MENRYYLAIDIGASSGRHILAHKKDGANCLRGDLSISKRNAGT